MLPPTGRVVLISGANRGTKRFGRIDVRVNNAHDSDMTLRDASEAALDKSGR
jgi:hypothetical protein